MTSIRNAALAAFAALALVFTASLPAQAEPTDEKEFSIGPAAQRQVGENGSLLFPVYESRIENVNPTAKPDFFAYCIEMTVKARFDVDVTLGTWAQFPGTNHFANNPAVQRKVGWVVNNSYPTISLNELRTRTGITDLTTTQAITGTQYAIWHFTDGATSTLSPNAAKLRSYLTGSANVGLAEDQVAPAVTISLAEGANTIADAPIGPVVVTANSAPITVMPPADLPIVTASGEPLTQSSFSSGDEFFLDAAGSSGSVTLRASVSAAQYSGKILRVPANNGKDPHAQTLILVTNSTATSEDSLDVTWTEPLRLTPRTPVLPKVDVAACIPGGPPADVEIVPATTEGITYVLPAGPIIPGETYEVIAVADEASILHPSAGWELLDDGTARTVITAPIVECPPAPEPEPEPEPLAEPEPELQPAPEPAARPEPLPETAEELPATGAANTGLVAVAAGLVLLGMAAMGGFRYRRNEFQ